LILNHHTPNYYQRWNVETVMTYFIFGMPGDDPREADVTDIAAVYYELPGPISEVEFDAREAAAAFEATVTAINNRTAFLVS
jgi:hypothetical protein